MPLSVVGRGSSVRARDLEEDQSNYRAWAALRIPVAKRSGVSFYDISFVAAHTDFQDFLNFSIAGSSVSRFSFNCCPYDAICRSFSLLCYTIASGKEM